MKLIHSGMTREQMIWYIGTHYKLLKLQVRVMRINDVPPEPWDFLKKWCENDEHVKHDIGILEQLVDHIANLIEINKKRLTPIAEASA